MSKKELLIIGAVVIGSLGLASAIADDGGGGGGKKTVERFGAILGGTPEVGEGATTIYNIASDGFTGFPEPQKINLRDLFDVPTPSDEPVVSDDDGGTTKKTVVDKTPIFTGGGGGGSGFTPYSGSVYTGSVSGYSGGGTAPSAGVVQTGFTPIFSGKKTVTDAKTDSYSAPKVTIVPKKSISSAFKRGVSSTFSAFKAKVSG